MRRIVFFLTILFLCAPLVAFAHSGGTDANGGHYDKSTGTYHYHHGYSAHPHTGGVCPYAYEDRTGSYSRPSTGSDSGNYGGHNSPSNSSSVPDVQHSSVSAVDPEHRSSKLWILSIIPFLLIVAFSFWLSSRKRKAAPASAGALPPVSPTVASPVAPPPAKKRPHKLVESDAIVFSFDGRSVPLYKICAIFLLRVGYLRDAEILFVMFFGDPTVHAFFHVPLSLCSELVHSDCPDLYFFDHIDGNFEYASIPFSR